MPATSVEANKTENNSLLQLNFPQFAEQQQEEECGSCHSVAWSSSSSSSSGYCASSSTSQQAATVCFNCFATPAACLQILFSWQVVVTLDIASQRYDCRPRCPRTPISRPDNPITLKPHTKYSPLCYPIKIYERFSVRLNE